MTKTAKLEIKLISSSLGEGNGDADELMVLEAFDDNGESCRLFYRIGARGTEHVSTNPGAEKLTGVYSGLHLVQLVTTALMEAFGPDNEVLHEVFAPEDNLCEKALTIEVPIPNFAGI